MFTVSDRSRPTRPGATGAAAARVRDGPGVGGRGSACPGDLAVGLLPRLLAGLSPSPGGPSGLVPPAVGTARRLTGFTGGEGLQVCHGQRAGPHLEARSYFEGSGRPGRRVHLSTWSHPARGVRVPLSVGGIRQRTRRVDARRLADPGLRDRGLVRPIAEQFTDLLRGELGVDVIVSLPHVGPGPELVEARHGFGVRVASFHLLDG